ncbi:MAG: HupE/UreJ family protein [Algicola sp.]|nr:HupE/UreJ family protein [Algicola sp.]
MKDVLFYLEEGVHHILDLNGLDHFFFILSFCLLYTFKDWKKILGLVTAFTLGHCLTLFLSGMDILTIDKGTVEMLIPITILLSCINNFWYLLTEKSRKQQITITYIILLVFGLIHGLGFSNYIKMMLFDDESLVLPLLGFNLGIEVAQLLIVIGFLAIISLFELLWKSQIKWVRFAVNLIIFILVLRMLFT